MPNLSILRRWLCAAAIGAALVFAATHGAAAHGYPRHGAHRHAHSRHRAAHGRRRGGARETGIQGSTALPIVAPDLVAEAERFLGRGNFTGLRVEWCKAALNVWLRRAGYFANSSLRAIDALALGPRLRSPAIGAIAVWSHHTGIIAGMTPRGPLLISGNWNRHVAEGIQRRGRFLGYVEPKRIHP